MLFREIFDRNFWRSNWISAIYRHCEMILVIFVDWSKITIYRKFRFTENADWSLMTINRKWRWIHIDGWSKLTMNRNWRLTEDWQLTENWNIQNCYKPCHWPMAWGIYHLILEGFDHLGLRSMQFHHPIEYGFGWSTSEKNFSIESLRNFRFFFRNF